MIEKILILEFNESDGENMSVYELSAKELYDSYARGLEPAELLRQRRNELAAQLQVDEGLSQKDAFYAVDKMLYYARQQIAADQSE